MIARTRQTISAAPNPAVLTISPRRALPPRTNSERGSAHGRAGRACRAGRSRPAARRERRGRSRPGTAPSPRSRADRGGSRRRRRRARGQAQDQRNAPGERDIEHGPPLGQKGLLLQEAKAPLQLEKGPAVRGEIFADAALFLVCEIRHGPRLRGVTPLHDSRIAYPDEDWSGLVTGQPLAQDFWRNRRVQARSFCGRSAEGSSYVDPGKNSARAFPGVGAVCRLRARQSADGCDSGARALCVGRRSGASGALERQGRFPDPRQPVRRGVERRLLRPGVGGDSAQRHQGPERRRAEGRKPAARRRSQIPASRGRPDHSALYAGQRHRQRAEDPRAGPRGARDHQRQAGPRLRLSGPAAR